MESKVARRTAAPAMSRGVRTARGAAISAAATLLAAASHALAGGEVTALSLLATAILALPLSVALAGHKLALLKLSISVGVAQFVYHWSFAGFGLFSERGNMSSPAPLHAAHMAQLETFVPDLASAGTASLAMWLSHATAAVFTIALLHRGELAYRTLARLVRRSVPIRSIAAVDVPRPARIVALVRIDVPAQIVRLTAITHRGPPRAA